jgi:hypothetical protein
MEYITALAMVTICLTCIIWLELKKAESLRSTVKSLYDLLEVKDKRISVLYDRLWNEQLEHKQRLIECKRMLSMAHGKINDLNDIISEHNQGVNESSKRKHNSSNDTDTRRDE